MSLSLFFGLRYEYINLSMCGCVGSRTEGLAASGGEKDSFKPNLVIASRAGQCVKYIF